MSVCGGSSETGWILLRKRLQDGAEGWLNAEHRFLSEEGCHSPLGWGHGGVWGMGRGNNLTL